ncbi:hypothetical protein O7632_25665 [Solwaraspora sp. WMMD406]|uniref:hypothetical protein n=1 Tax=Solwaraspora sp. WMMD406 TaxID=3016095 RepID=UPI002415CDC4|nr:hypothetical protein [Solwaraspora sp. WMMD406]MDG4767452.1 hypothetical protein [Solwaraspora sp. WMMD406]
MSSDLDQRDMVEAVTVGESGGVVESVAESVVESVAEETGYDIHALLRLAHRCVVTQFGDDDPLSQTAMHLISSAAELVVMLPVGDLDAARQALSHARAAVTTASYAVHRVHDEARSRAS